MNRKSRIARILHSIFLGIFFSSLISMVACAAWIHINKPTTSSPAHVDIEGAFTFSVSWDVTDHPDYNSANGVVVVFKVRQESGTSIVWYYPMSGSGSKSITMHGASEPGSYYVEAEVWSYKPGGSGTDSWDKKLASHREDNAVIVGGGASPSLSRSPSSLDFGTSSTSKTFSVWNSDGGTLNYTISDNKSWISVSPTSGSSTGEHDTITVTVNRSGLAEGHHTGTVTINSNGGNQTVQVAMDVPAATPTPHLSRSPSSLDFGTSSTSKTFRVWNSDGGTLTYTITDNKSWISVSPTSGSSTGEHDTIRVNVNRSNLAPGHYTGTITIRSNAGNATVLVSLTESCKSPSVPALLYPQNGSSCIPPNVELRWEYPGINTSRIHFLVYWRAKRESGWTPWEEYTPPAGELHAQPGFWEGLKYEWYVEAMSTGCPAEHRKSEIWSFTTANHPVAAFEAFPPVSNPGRAIRFDASQSLPSTELIPCQITSYEWDFGDGSSATGAEVIHTYVTAGIKTVKLKITNTAGLTDTQEMYLPVRTVVEYPNSEAVIPSDTLGIVIFLFQKGRPVTITLNGRSIGPHVTLKEYLRSQIEPQWFKEGIKMLVGLVPTVGSVLNGLDTVMSNLNRSQTLALLDDLANKPEIWGTVYQFDPSYSNLDIVRTLLPGISEACARKLSLAFQINEKGHSEPIFRALSAVKSFAASNNTIFIDDYTLSEMQRVIKLWGPRGENWRAQLAKWGYLNCS